MWIFSIDLFVRGFENLRGVKYAFVQLIMQSYDRGVEHNELICWIIAA